MLWIIFYSFFIHILLPADCSYAQSNLFLLFESFFFTFILAFLLAFYYGENAEKVILVVAIIASLITLFLMLNPVANVYVRDSLLQTDEKFRDFSFRSFGISDSLVFTYAIVQGIMAAICLKLANKSFLYYIGFILLLISVAFNARIGFIPIFIYCIYLFFIERKIKRLLLLAAFVVLGCLLFLNSDLAVEFDTTIEWIMDFFIEMINFVTGQENDKIGNTDVLKDMLVIPETLSGILFGTGEDVFVSAKQNSDIGYIIQLNYGGLVYVCSSLILVLFLYLKLLKLNQNNRWYNIVFLGTVLICNYKGFFLMTNPGMRLVMLLFFIYIINGNREKFFKYESLNTID